MDEAFKSRIHIALEYSKLQKGQTKMIWRNHIRRLRQHVENIIIEEDNLMDYMEKHYDDQLKLEKEDGGCVWNGRQIRNAFQSAYALAVYEARDKSRIKLKVSNFEEVAKFANMFNKYLFETQSRRSADQIASGDLIRAPV
jgi:hypothetical protein